MRPPVARIRRSGFTLIELMVSLALLSVFMVLTAVITRNALDLHGATEARLVTERNAAAFLRQFEEDIAQRILRAETRLRVEKAVGNDELAMQTQRQGYALREAAADRRAALVSYRINHQMLERAASGYGFGESARRPDEQAGTLALAKVPAAGPPDPDERAFQTIAPGIFRLEFTFVVRDGEQWVLRSSPPADERQLAQVIATVAVFDPARSRMLRDADLKLLAAAFPDARDGETPLKEWTEIAATLSRKLPNLPRPPLRHVRVYQSVCGFPQPFIRL